MRKLVFVSVVIALLALTTSCFTLADSKKMDRGISKKIIVTDIKKDILFKKTRAVFETCFDDLDFEIVSESPRDGVIYGTISKSYESTSYAGGRRGIVISNVKATIKDEVVEIRVWFKELGKNNGVVLTDKDQVVIENDWKKIISKVQDELTALESQEEDEEEYILVKRKKK